MASKANEAVTTSGTKGAYTRGDLVEYVTPLGHRVSAIVRRKHRDGDYSVEGRFFLNRTGQTETDYIGHVYRISGKLLAPHGEVDRAALSKANGEQA